MASSASKEEEDALSIVELFDQLCFSFGEEDAIELVQAGGGTNTCIGYIELQEYSKALAHQLYWRFRPTWVLVDCHGWPGAEIVSLLACMRLGIPFVPVSCRNQHAGTGRLRRIVEQLKKNEQSSSPNNNLKIERDSARIVALTCCENDQDPVLGVFQNANVHSILFLSQDGNLQERLDVPSYLPQDVQDRAKQNDNLYVLFTSGTSGQTPKAVIGSQQSTLQRLQWFQQTFPPLRRVAKRTPLTFVDAIAELLGTLLTRESLLVALVHNNSGTNSFVETLNMARLIEETQCHQISLLPSQLDPILRLQQHHHQSLVSLQRIVISGEPCLPSLWHCFCQVFASNSCQLINLYGQTETTGDCCAAILTELPSEQVVVHNTVAIGRPICSNTSIHTADAATFMAATCTIDNGNHDSTTNQGHELIVSGYDCLANGYLGNDATEKGFTINEGKTTSFATGDIGFCRNGIWYVQGRKDYVQKVNGVWTAPSEVETAFLDYYRRMQDSAASTDSLEAAAAAILDNRVYVLLERQGDSTIDFSRERIKQKTGLPWNLIPQQVFPCHSLPRTSGTGKVDRAQVMNILKARIQEERSSRPKCKDTTATMTNGSNEMDVSKQALLGRFRAVVESVLIPSWDIANGEDVSGDSTPVGTCAPRHDHSDIDMSKSFVELGGDSALAVSLHYQLRMDWGAHYAVFANSLAEKNGIKQETNPLSDVTPMGLLNAESLMLTFSALTKEPSTKVEDAELSRKRPKLSNDGVKPEFKHEALTVWCNSHASAAFAACVDVTPIVTTAPKSNNAQEYRIVAGCQNGVAQMIALRSLETSLLPDKKDIFEGTRTGFCHHFTGWRISYMLLHDPSSGGDNLSTMIIVCLVRHPKQVPEATTGAKVVAMSTDMSFIHWAREFDLLDTVASPPVVCDDRLWVVVTSSTKRNPNNALPSEDDMDDADDSKKHQIVLLNLKDGSIDGSCTVGLPVRVVSSAAMLDCNFVRADDGIAAKVLIYSSCDWETGLLLVDVERKQLLPVPPSALELDDTDKDSLPLRFFTDSLGPVYKDPVAWDTESLLVADSWGSLHRVNLCSLTCTTCKVSSKALSAPAIVPPSSGNMQGVVVGSYDGMVSLVNADLTEILWTCSVQSVVYTRPLVLSFAGKGDDCDSVVVCTTSGDVVQLRGSDGALMLRYQIPIGAEIWSSPAALPMAVGREEEHGASRVVVFGARDSRLHFVKVSQNKERGTSN
ncbi:D-alanine--D-alanyl carrier protein ligase [Seminavis robusta]|uniref:D-alanine--D-alanyl carrier protein ligase n=1 Tax=Seminavis robusta TaxID=568900 RepID=A0A9N8DFS9_9STRA|nr:D-alanine--D-alanyl carrier protein ligase [Seminavis robusta]|eukprot:Sro71_g039350.1 D-alanine--D-alanyl carrier protein ligase (1229) ;mRNA; f:53846-57532